MEERNKAEQGTEYHGRSGSGWVCGRRVFSIFSRWSQMVLTQRDFCVLFKVRVMRHAFPHTKVCFSFTMVSDGCRRCFHESEIECYHRKLFSLLAQVTRCGSSFPRPIAHNSHHGAGGK